MSNSDIAGVISGIVILFICVLGFTFNGAVSEGSSVSTFEKNELEKEIKEKIDAMNNGEAPPDFGWIYYHKRVGLNSSVLSRVEAFKDDFKDNFESYESRRRKGDIFKISEDYTFGIQKSKREGVWIYQVNITAILKVNYQRSIYFLGTEEYEKNLGVMEFILANDGGKVGLESIGWQ